LINIILFPAARAVRDAVSSASSQVDLNGKTHSTSLAVKAADGGVSHESHESHDFNRPDSVDEHEPSSGPVNGPVPVDNGPPNNNNRPAVPVDNGPPNSNNNNGPVPVDNGPPNSNNNNGTVPVDNGPPNNNNNNGPPPPVPIAAGHKSKIQKVGAEADFRSGTAIATISKRSLTSQSAQSKGNVAVTKIKDNSNAGLNLKVL
jgi:hypothetical protein